MVTGVEQELLDAYDEGGQYAVYDLVRDKYPEWEWSPCYPCEDDTPTWSDQHDEVCAVCFSVKAEPK